MSSLRARRIARNPFAFPGGNSGINLLHPLAGSLAFCGVPVGSMFIDLLNGKQGGGGGSATAATDGWLGAGVGNTSAGAAITFAGRSTTAPTNFTIAGLFRQSNVAFFHTVFSNSSTFTSGVSILCASGAGGTMGLYVNNSAKLVTSAGAVPANTPLFVAVAATSAGSADMVYSYLSTGQIFTLSTAGPIGSTSAPTGTFHVLQNSFANAGFEGNVARIAYSQSVRMPLAQLTQWAADPWSLWVSG